MKKVLLGLLSLSFCFSVSAQISYGGAPRGLKAEKTGIALPNVIKLPTVDVKSLMAEDEAKLTSGIKGPFRFGFNHAVDLSTSNSGVWHTFDNGDRMWRITVRSKGAFAINMEFHEYVIPTGAEVYIYNTAGQHLGSYTAESNGNRPTMGVQPIAGDEVTVEYFEPAAVAGQGSLQIGQITHAYRDPFGQAKGFGNSGSCNNNVICPEGDDWRDEIASVARIVVNGGDWCTGSLINNCAEDGHPYFLTANHCISGNVNNWVFWFNWESPTCSPTTNGPQNQTISGSSLLAQSSGSDVALLELNSAPPASYNAVYTGWDKSGTAPTAVTGIHHPSGDIKKITFDDDGATATTWGGAQVWEIANWEDGTTEPGSSGSGLWNQNHRLIGQLFGGSASCSSISNDDYGRFNVSYTVLAAHLGNCGNTIGHYPAAMIVDYDAMISSINNIPASQCNSDVIDAVINVKNSGGVTLTSFDVQWNIDGGTSTTVNWTGSLTGGQDVDITIPTQMAGNGAHTFNASVSSPNGQLDQNTGNDTGSFDFAVNNPGQNINIVLTLDNYGSETTWIVTDMNGVELYSGGPYLDGMDGSVITEPICLGNECYDLTIYDSASDGMCCDYGTGSVVVNDDFGTVYATNNGEFFDDVTENFCITAAGILGHTLVTDLNIFPNPTEGLIQINLPAVFEGSADVSFIDATGRVVKQIALNSIQDRIDLNVSDLANGSYTVSLVNGDRHALGRFVLNH